MPLSMLPLLQRWYRCLLCLFTLASCQRFCVVLLLQRTIQVQCCECSVNLQCLAQCACSFYAHLAVCFAAVYVVLFVWHRLVSRAHFWDSALSALSWFSMPHSVPLLLQSRSRCLLCSLLMQCLCLALHSFFSALSRSSVASLVLTFNASLRAHSPWSPKSLTVWQHLRLCVCFLLALTCL